MQVSRGGIERISKPDMPKQSQPEPLCVVIAAQNAEDTIADAVSSALAQDEVGEIVVVDDASTDHTADVARTTAGTDTRLKCLSLGKNIGPAAARNLAIRSSVSPLIAVLDADDFFLPGRFAHLLSMPDWDLVADNIVFVETSGDQNVPMGSNLVEDLDLTAFVLGNLSSKATERGELGFLKPIMRRAFLDLHGLCYDPGLRLGEDYDLYVRCLMNGARFRLSHRVGYAAVMRNDSLSARHRTADLKTLLDAVDRHLAAPDQEAVARALMAELRAQTRRRHVLREFLDRKAGGGMAAALSYALSPLHNLMPIAQGVVADKLRARRRIPPAEGVVRTLLPIGKGTSLRPDLP